MCVKKRKREKGTERGEREKETGGEIVSYYGTDSMWLRVYLRLRAESKGYLFSLMGPLHFLVIDTD